VVPPAVVATPLMTLGWFSVSTDEAVVGMGVGCGLATLPAVL
jgi:hypothetical protein